MKAIKEPPPSDVDGLLGVMEAALEKVEASQSSKVRLPQAELDLLSSFQAARNLMMSVLSNQCDRSMLLRVFGGENALRIERIRSVLKVARFSDMNRADPRPHQCLVACMTVERVLADHNQGTTRKSREIELQHEQALARERERLAGAESVSLLHLRTNRDEQESDLADNKVEGPGPPGKLSEDLLQKFAGDWVIADSHDGCDCSNSGLTAPPMQEEAPAATLQTTPTPFSCNADYIVCPTKHSSGAETLAAPHQIACKLDSEDVVDLSCSMQRRAFDVGSQPYREFAAQGHLDNPPECRPIAVEPRKLANDTGTTSTPVEGLGENDGVSSIEVELQNGEQLFAAIAAEGDLRRPLLAASAAALAAAELETSGHIEAAIQQYATCAAELEVAAAAQASTTEPEQDNPEEAIKSISLDLQASATSDNRAPKLGHR